MRKLKLQIDDLEVASFQTDAAPEARGTVAGYKTLPPTEGGTCAGDWTCDPYAETCNGGFTCGHTCGNTCENTCGCGSAISDCALCVE